MSGAELTLENRLIFIAAFIDVVTRSVWAYEHHTNSKAYSIEINMDYLGTICKMLQGKTKLHCREITERLVSHRMKVLFSVLSPVVPCDVMSY